MIHILKILPEYFTAVANEMKTFEVRRDDRPFSLYDTLLLKEWANGHYTGRTLTARISYILRNDDEHQYCAPGYCILALRAVRILS